MGFPCGLALLFQSAPLVGQPPAERDWSAALREDAQALHDDIAANHPGPVNPQDPGFAKRNDAQLVLALRRARDARTYADYFFPLRQYVASFSDGHMGFGAYGDTPNDFRWPGFLTGYDGRGDVKVLLTTDQAKVPVGARLLGCDGMTAEQYGAATLGKMWGRWQLASQRLAFGRSLFLDEGSRYVPHASRCRFAVGGRQRVVALAWRPLGFAEFRDRMKAISPQISWQFGARVLSDGTRWYSIPSFNADPRSPAGKALPPMIAAMQAERGTLAAAPSIVLDVRGNGGGSSDWSRQIAEVLWGRAVIQRHTPSNVHVDWRVSRANLEAMQQAFARQDAGHALSPEMRAYFGTVINGLTAALARGDRLWREPDEGDQNPVAATRQEPPPSPLAGPVYLLTDASCGSACLDAVDLWRALGAVHVGQTTGADTLYMEVRNSKLPSGITGVSMPMKVYRGRPRGSNQPVVPKYSFGGDIADTAAIERWIATLEPKGHPRGRRRGGLFAP
ncbi:MAG: hypothetical protein QOK17_1452 [Sphingomonadales bacterium]|jgi:hypothetical protein|nr:hypothetical protein [Sphingomonadales bacterium]